MELNKILLTVLVIIHGISAIPIQVQNSSQVLEEVDDILEDELEAALGTATENVDDNDNDTDNDLWLTHAQKVAFGWESEDNDNNGVQDTKKRKMIARPGAVSLWTNGRMPWLFNAHNPPSEFAKSQIRKALQKLERDTCLQFPELFPGHRESNYVKFTKLRGCLSSLGMMRGSNGQILSIGSGCSQLGTITHEILHALGMYHEQMRSDRDQYITFNSKNVRQGKNFNFYKVNSVNLAPFDENSLMMYGSYVFSSNGKPTLESKNSRLINSLFGQRSTLSFYDSLALHKAYQCDKHCRTRVNTVNKCHNGGFLNKNCQCQCPKGLAGPQCEDHDVTAFSWQCGGIVRLNPGEKHTFTNPGYPGPLSSPVNCAWIFISPNGTYLELEFENLNLETNFHGKCDDKVEVRFNLPGQRGFDFCHKPTTKLSTHFRMTPQMSVFLTAKSSKSHGFKAHIEAKTPSACSKNPCLNNGKCHDNGHEQNFHCACPDGFSGFFCEIAETADILIDFESGMEPMKQVQGDDLDWTLQESFTTSVATGPDAAHSGRYYIYVEASQHAEQVAIVSTTLILSTRPRVVSFYYHMNGDTMGTLSLVKKLTDDSENVIWTKTGDQGNTWRKAEIVIPAGHMDYFLQFKGLVGSSYNSDMALDDILIKTDTNVVALVRATAAPITSTTEITVDFENGIEPFQNVGQKLWKVHTGRTPSRLTGPNTAFQGQKYLYFEVTGLSAGDSATIQSPVIDNRKKICVLFHYHMYGSSMGELKISLTASVSRLEHEERIWSKSQDQGNLWYQGKIEIPAKGFPYRIRFTAVRGWSYTGDIALDNIRIRANCREQ